MLQDLTPKFYDLVVTEKLYPTQSNLKFYLNYLFGDLDFKNKNVLDVGGGWGLLTFYAAINGAKKAVCLDPETDGSTIGVTKKFASVKAALSESLPAILFPLTLQDYAKSFNEKIDVVVFHNSVNHLNEAACTSLLTDKTSYNAYKTIFSDVYACMNPGGILIITDCGRRNFFNDVGLKCWFAPTIEWHLHQQPKTWLSLLKETGFTNGKLQWKSPNSFGKIGRLIMGNALVAYLTTSMFKIRVQKPRGR